MITKDEHRLQLYQDTINRIDDYFEYRYESVVDKDHVQSVLNTLTTKLSKLYNNND